jgi:hypothetical protein
MLSRFSLLKKKKQSPIAITIAHPPSVMTREPSKKNVFTCAYERGFD